MLGRVMSDDDNSPISVREARRLFAGLKAAPALLLAVSGGPDSVALMWLAARWRRGLARGPQLTVVTVDHGLRPEAAREAREVKRLESGSDCRTGPCAGVVQSRRRDCRPRRARRATACSPKPRGPWAPATC